jgi:hypothetical protein
MTAGSTFQRGWELVQFTSEPRKLMVDGVETHVVDFNYLQPCRLDPDGTWPIRWSHRKFTEMSKPKSVTIGGRKVVREFILVEVAFPVDNVSWSTEPKKQSGKLVKAIPNCVIGNLVHAINRIEDWHRANPTVTPDELVTMAAAGVLPRSDRAPMTGDGDDDD